MHRAATVYYSLHTGLANATISSDALYCTATMAIFFNTHFPLQPPLVSLADIRHESPDLLIELPPGLLTRLVVVLLDFLKTKKKEEVTHIKEKRSGLMEINLLGVSHII